MNIPKRSLVHLTAAVAATCSLQAAPQTASATADGLAAADSAMSLAGNSEGTVFKSLTVEAENRVQIRFDRPELLIELDPSAAPGLTWGSSQDVLDRTVPDLVTPYLTASTLRRSPHTARPWIEAYRQGPVVVFNSALVDVVRWHLQVVDSRGQQVHEMSGKKNPPSRIPWNGRAMDGTAVMPGLTYSFVIEAYDKAGNKRRFVGDAFQIPAYLIDGDAGPEFLISGHEWQEAARGTANGRSPYLLETASWLNLHSGAVDPVIVHATARTYPAAEALGRQAAEALQPLLFGGASRIAVTARTEPGAPEGGVLHIKRQPLSRSVP